MEKYLENLNWRYATKKFDSTKKLSGEQLNLVKEAMRLSPSSFGLQLWKFYQIDSPDVREKLKEAAWGQPQVTDVSHLFVFASKTDVNESDLNSHIQELIKDTGQTEESLQGYKDMVLGFMKSKTKEQLASWASRQAYIALGFALSAAARMNVDTCPMEGFDASKFDEILGTAKDGYSTLAMLAVGFRSPEDKYALAPRVRFPAEKVFSVK